MGCLWESGTAFGLAPGRNIHIAGGDKTYSSTDRTALDLKPLTMKQAEKLSSYPSTGDHIYVLRSLSYAHHGKLFFMSGFPFSRLYTIRFVFFHI